MKYLGLFDFAWGIVQKHGETAEEAAKQITGQGYEIVEIGDLGDSVIALIEDGKLLLCGYVSTRGSLYQAGVFDGRDHYSANNAIEEHGGVPTGWVKRKSVCSEIAEDGFNSMMVHMEVK